MMTYLHFESWKVKIKTLPRSGFCIITFRWLPFHTMHQVLAVEDIEKKRGRQAVELGISGFLSTIQRACPILGRIPPFLNNYNTPNQTHLTESSKHSLATKHQAAYVTDLNQPITMPDAIMCFQTRTDCFSLRNQSCKIQTWWILEQCEQSCKKWFK